MNIAEQVFKYIYDNNIWGGKSLSGPGSELENTKNLRLFISEFIEKYDIKSMIDAPCGDMFWFSKLKLDDVQYYGYDIVDDIIVNNKKKFKDRKNYIFEKKDVVLEKLPKADLIMCRDLIIHLPIEAVFVLIKNFIRSEAKYLLITQHVVLNDKYPMNTDIKVGSFAFRNLTLPPFNFPAPKLLVPEEWPDKNCLRFMALYELKELDKFYKKNSIKIVFNEK